MLITILALGSAAAGSPPTGVPYAAWGESPEKLIADSHGSSVAIPEKDDERIYDLDNLAKGTGAWHGIPVEAEFYFTQGTHRLGAIRLTPADITDCEKLKSEASATFGTGTVAKQLDESQYPNVHFNQNLSINWANAGANLRTAIIDVEAGELHLCHLIYRPY